MYIKEEVTFETAKKLIKKGEVVYLSGNEARGIGKTRFIVELSNMTVKYIIATSNAQRDYLLGLGAKYTTLIREPQDACGYRFPNGVLVDGVVGEGILSLLNELAYKNISGFLLED